MARDKNQNEAAELPNFGLLYIHVSLIHTQQ